MNREECHVKAHNLRRKVTDLIQEGNVHRIKIKDKRGRVLLNIPITVAAVGSLFAPALAGIGVIASLLTECTLEVEKREDKGKKPDLS